MALKKLGTGQGYVKAGIQGFAASGKTYTAIDMAIGIRDYFKIIGPIAFFDTEGGSEYVAAKVRKSTGLDLVGDRSQSFTDLMSTAHDCVKEGVSVLVVDSVSHVWTELQRSHLDRVNQNRDKKNLSKRYNLEFQDWAPIKEKWSEWTRFFLNSKLHIIFCGRAGFTYDHEKNEETGKKELVKTGTKMKAENEFGYEPSLLIQMEAVKSATKGVYIHQATILKDRFDKINGITFDNPNFGTFLPHIAELIPGAWAPVDTSIKTEPLVDEEGHDDRRRLILLEEIQGEIVALYPGQTAKEKKAKADLIFSLFNTRSWTRVESMGLDQLKFGLASIRQMSGATQVQTEQVLEEIPFEGPQ